MSGRLDQFYTKREIAKQCYRHAIKTIKCLTGKAADDFFFVEPSAGCGDFFDLLPVARRIGIDIEPQCAELIKADFLRWSCPHSLPSRADVIAIGNPPFGHRANMAVKFFNKAAELADMIALILPVQFRKYSVHKLLNQEFDWVRQYKLPTLSFYTRGKRDYQLNAEFQIWTRLPHKYRNLRLMTPPPIAHPDFEMWQYNNTKQALKVFDNQFDFAVPRQGYQDYRRRETSAENCERTKQWILFRSKNLAICKRLYQMDFEKISRNNTITPGFGKADVVSAYRNIYDRF